MIHRTTRAAPHPRGAAFFTKGKGEPMGHIFALTLGVIAVLMSIAVLVVLAIQLVSEFVAWAMSL